MLLFTCIGAIKISKTQMKIIQKKYWSNLEANVKENILPAKQATKTTATAFIMMPIDPKLENDQYPTPPLFYTSPTML